MRAYETKLNVGLSSDTAFEAMSYNNAGMWLRWLYVWWLEEERFATQAVTNIRPLCLKFELIWKLPMAEKAKGVVSNKWVNITSWVSEAEMCTQRVSFGTIAPFTSTGFLQDFTQCNQSTSDSFNDVCTLIYTYTYITMRCVTLGVRGQGDG